MEDIKNNMQTTSFCGVSTRTKHPAIQICMMMISCSIAKGVVTHHVTSGVISILDTSNILGEVCLTELHVHFVWKVVSSCNTDLESNHTPVFVTIEILGIVQFTLCVFYDLSIVVKFTRLIYILNPDLTCSLCRL